MISLRNVSKRFGDSVAVDRLSFDVRPGVVTGLVGRNGAGKSTTLRLIAGTASADDGHIDVNGMRLSGSVPSPFAIGALPDPTTMRGDRSAYTYLLELGDNHGISRSRVDVVVESVGLSRSAHQPVGGFSAGALARLGVAVALLADPPVLLLDDPISALDPDGRRWIGELLRDLASEGRTVLVASNSLEEIAQTADQLLVMDRGRLIADAATADFLSDLAAPKVQIVSPDSARLRMAISDADAVVVDLGDLCSEVTGLSAEEVGRLAHETNAVVYELAEKRASLATAFTSTHLVAGTRNSDSLADWAERLAAEDYPG